MADEADEADGADCQGRPNPTVEVFSMLIEDPESYEQDSCGVMMSLQQELICIFMYHKTCV